MAKYTVECEDCKKEIRIELFGKTRQREWIINNKTFICDNCKAKAKEEASAEAAKKAEEKGLPELEGTEKQIKWAEVLRLEILRKLAIASPRAKDVDFEAIKGQTDATFWIDRRDVHPERIFKEFQKSEIAKKETEKELEADAAAEATIRPEKTITETPAEIAINGKYITIKLPERIESFRLLARSLGYAWTGSYGITGVPANCWSRMIDDDSIKERVVEMACKTILLGISVKIYDQELKSKVIIGEYSEEPKNIITEKGGKFAISWKEGDFYKQARRLPTSKWEKPYVTVMAYQFEEVLGFADAHGFRLDKHAESLAEKAKTIRDESITVTLAKKEKKTPGKRPNLKPEETGIADEFKD